MVVHSFSRCLGTEAVEEGAFGVWVESVRLWPISPQNGKAKANLQQLLVLASPVAIAGFDRAEWQKRGENEENNGHLLRAIRPI